MAASSTKVMRAWLYSNATAVPGGLSKNLTLSKAAAHPSPASPPKLAADELLVRVRSSALNVADYKLPELPAGMSRAMISVPASPGCDFAGTVVAVGKGPAAVAAAGESVFGRLDPTRYGTLGEFVVAKAAGCARVPEGVSLEQAGAVGTAGLVAYQSIAPHVPQDGAANRDFRVFINGGSGGVGTMGIQIAKALGCHVTASCSPRNIALCKRLGADEVLDYTAGSLSDALRTRGPVFSLVVDNVGSPADLYKAADDFLLPTGKFVQVGADMSLAGMRNITSRMMLPSFFGGGARPFELLQVKNKREDLIQLGDWLAAGKLQVVVDEVFAFEDAPKAIEKLRQGHATGKIIVQGLKD